MNSVLGWRAVSQIKVKAVRSEMIDEVLHHQHPLRVDVVEGDGEVAAAVHAVFLPVLDVLNRRELD